ncbi:MAG: hypothetical protein IJ002_03120 [Clostridia bacterium]|nr:hypothetical protein [Clostridia bacterium]MBQ8836483.1 hypothetical protein [Clostridia bacterium]
MSLENVDWNEIKKEYISSATSYRKLCAKYGVPRTTLEKRAKDEKWTDLRRQVKDKAEADMVRRVAEESSKVDHKYFRLVDKLIDKADEVIENTPVWQVQSIKDMASALRSLRECRGFKTDIDLREQEARIKNLERQLEKSDDIPEINVVFGSDEDFAK